MNGIGRVGLVYVAGLEVFAWVDMFKHCHNKQDGQLLRAAWPDGTSYLEQPNVVVSMFSLLEDVYRQLKEK